jgi:hypothetical protein
MEDARLAQHDAIKYQCLQNTTISIQLHHLPKKIRNAHQTFLAHKFFKNLGL